LIQVIAARLRRGFADTAAGADVPFALAIARCGGPRDGAVALPGRGRAPLGILHAE